MRLGPEAASPFDGLRLEYINPVTGGPSLPTMASFLQRLTPGLQTQAHRHSASAVYLAVEGHGRTTIEGKAYDWAVVVNRLFNAIRRRLGCSAPRPDADPPRPFR